MASDAAYENESTSPDRRVHARQPLPTLAYVEIDEGNGGILLNISEGGLSVQAVTSITDNVFPKMRFQLAHSKDWLQAGARVAWMDGEGKVAGLEFVDLPESTRTRLRDWMSSEASSSTMEEAPPERRAVRRLNEESILPPALPVAIPREPKPFPPRPTLLPEVRKETPAIPEIPHAAQPVPAQPPAPIYQFGQSITRTGVDGLFEAAPPAEEGPSKAWIAISLLLFLAILATAAGWIAGGGALDSLMSSVFGISPGGNQDTAAPSAPRSPVSDIEIVDGNNQQWTVPFNPEGAGAGDNQNSQSGQAPQPAQAGEQSGSVVSTPPAETQPANSAASKPKPSAKARLSHPEDTPPAAPSTDTEAGPPSAMPGIPQAGALQPGEILSRVDPVYPEEAQERRIEGVVKLRVTIRTDGSVNNVYVLSGPGPLVEAAKAAVRQWRYTPTLLDGKPVEAEEFVSMVFQLPPAPK